jgi:hypothetical protein
MEENEKKVFCERAEVVCLPVTSFIVPRFMAFKFKKGA